MQFKEYLKYNNISQKQAACELGTSEANVSRWCHGVRPRYPMLHKIMEWSDGQVRVRDWSHTIVCDD